MKHNPNESRLVYSTGVGRICVECQKPEANCVCKERKNAEVKGSGTVRVRRETKSRAGKTVSTISGVPLHKAGLEKLLSELKRACGAGGALKDGVLEIQGEHIDFLIQELKKRGYAAKQGGG